MSLIDFIDSNVDRQKDLRKFFSSPGVFDGLTNVLVQEMRKSPIRPHLSDKNARMAVIDQVVTLIQEMCQEKNIELHDFPEIIERMSFMKLNLKKAELGPEFQGLQSNDEIVYKMYLKGYHKKCNHHWRPEDIRRVGLDQGLFKGFNSGGLLWGIKGSGKSQILAYLTAWAHENNWVNLTVASCPEFVDATHDIERMENGLYIQHTLAQRMLNDLKI